jgi:hypothetical protein
MWADLLTIIPVGVGLGLLAFGRYGGRNVRPTPRGATVVGVMSFLLGPVAVGVLGFFGWLLLLLVMVAAMIVAAVLRPRRTPLRG